MEEVLQRLAQDANSGHDLLKLVQIYWQDVVQHIPESRKQLFRQSMRDEFWCRYQTVLSLCIECGFAELSRLLIADEKCRDRVAQNGGIWFSQDRDTCIAPWPLSVATMMDDVAVVKQLLIGGHNPNIAGYPGCLKPNGMMLRTPLGVAIEMDSKILTQVLLPYCNMSELYLKKGPLHYACEYGAKRCFTRLLREAPFSLNAVDDAGFTPLMYAAKNSHYDIVKTLLNVGASTGVPSGSPLKGCTLIDLALDIHNSPSKNYDDLPNIITGLLLTTSIESPLTNLCRRLIILGNSKDQENDSNIYDALIKCIPPLLQAPKATFTINPMSEVFRYMLESLTMCSRMSREYTLNVLQTSSDVIITFLKQGVDPQTPIPGRNPVLYDPMMAPLSAIIKAMCSLGRHVVLVKLVGETSEMVSIVFDIVTLLLLYGGRYSFDDFVELTKLMTIDNDTFVPFIEIGINASPELYTVPQVSAAIPEHATHHREFISSLCERSLMAWCRLSILERLRQRHSIREDINNLQIPGRYKSYLSSLRHY